MDLDEWIDKVGYIKPVLNELTGDENDCVFSKFDDSYITMLKLKDNVKFLADLGITEKLTHGVGFSPEEDKWYGWSHRAIFGFTVGSTVKKGDCNYQPKNRLELYEAALKFYEIGTGWRECETHHVRCCANLVRVNYNAEDCDQKGMRIYYFVKFKGLPRGDKRFKGYQSSVFVPYTYGRGQWKAETMDDAKQMAVDFYEGVS